MTQPLSTLSEHAEAVEVIAFMVAAMDALQRASRALGVTLGEPAAAPELTELTGREREVAILVGSGHSNQQIARRLCVSVRTVEAHLSHIYRKLRVESRVALCRLVAVST